MLQSKPTQYKMIIATATVALVVVAVYVIWQVLVLQKAHSTFENYYKFRGCVQLVTKTPAYGVCKLSSGKTIKIVLYHGKWYLDNDLPIGLWGHLN